MYPKWYVEWYIVCRGRYLEQCFYIAKMMHPILPISDTINNKFIDTDSKSLRLWKKFSSFLYFWFLKWESDDISNCSNFKVYTSWNAVTNEEISPSHEKFEQLREANIWKERTREAFRTTFWLFWVQGKAVGGHSSCSIRFFHLIFAIRCYRIL